MKRLVILVLLLTLLLPGTTLTAAAAPEDIPSLTEISFYGAEIDGDFSSDIYSYALTLTDTKTNPTLKSYRTDGSCELFVTYQLDSARHQTGILVTLQFDGGSIEYRFDYANAEYDSRSGDNYLASVTCRYCEIYPQINERTTAYKLYIPSDLTELNLSVATRDINAYCDLPKTISLSEKQEPEFSLTVTAANGSTKDYRLKIKRLNKTIAQIAAEQKSTARVSLIPRERIWNRPAFTATVITAATGLIAVTLLVHLLLKKTVKAADPDEKDFFDTTI